MSLTDAAVTTRASSQPSVSTATCRPWPVTFLPPWYPLVLPGTVSWALIICESAISRRLRGPSLMLAQQLAQPGDERLRQAAAVPPLEEGVRRLPRRQIDGQGAPLDSVLHHVRHGVAHRPQVMHHRPAYGDGEFAHHLARPRLEHRPLGIGQVGGVHGRRSRHQQPGEAQGWRTRPRQGKQAYGSLAVRKASTTSELPGAPSRPAAPRRAVTQSRRLRHDHPHDPFIYRL